MKTTKLISGVVSILVLLAFTLGYAEEEKAYVPKDDEEIYGTWVNTEYDWLSRAQKLIMYPDGRVEYFPKESDTSPTFAGTFTIIDKWTDSEESIWYKLHFRGDWFRYELDKISNSGTTWEYVSNPAYYPVEIDPTHPNYGIHYRK